MAQSCLQLSPELQSEIDLDAELGSWCPAVPAETRLQREPRSCSGQSSRISGCRHPRLSLGSNPSPGRPPPHHLALTRPMSPPVPVSCPGPGGA